MTKNLGEYQKQHKYEQDQRALILTSEAKRRKEENDLEAYKMKVLKLAKWELVKTKKEQMMMELNKLVAVQTNAKRIISHMFLREFLFKLYGNFVK